MIFPVKGSGTIYTNHFLNKGKSTIHTKAKKLKNMNHVHIFLSKLYHRDNIGDFRATSMIFVAVNWLNKLRGKIILIN